MILWWHTRPTWKRPRCPPVLGHSRQFPRSVGAAKMTTRDDRPDVDDLIRQLHRAGWSVDHVDFAAEDGSLVWVVSGSNGENLVHASGPTAVEAWRRAAEQARLLGMLWER